MSFIFGSRIETYFPSYTTRSIEGGKRYPIFNLGLQR